MKKWLIALVGGVAALAFLYMATGPRPPAGGDKPVAATPLIPVKISQAFQHLLYIGLYVALDGNFFKDEGLDVSISTAGGDAQAFAALTAGEADFAQGDPAFVAIGHEKGWEGRVVAIAVDRVAIWGITFDPKIKPFSDPKGFRNMKVATYPSPNTSYVVQKELAIKAGLKLGKDTEIVQVQFGSEIAAAKEGRVSIAQTIEPNATQVESQGGHVVFSYPDAWGPLAFTGLMVSKQYLDEKPALVQKVVNAYQRAFDYIAANRDGTVKIAKKYLPNLDETTIRTALNRLLNSGSIPRRTIVDPESWLKLLKIRVAVGDLKALPNTMLFDNTFAESAWKTLK